MALSGLSRALERHIRDRRDTEGGRGCADVPLLICRHATRLVSAAAAAAVGASPLIGGQSVSSASSAAPQSHL